eukprot:Gb_32001 [translate_table: standard]
MGLGQPTKESHKNTVYPPVKDKWNSDRQPYYCSSPEKHKEGQNSLLDKTKISLQVLHILALRRMEWKSCLYRVSCPGFKSQVKWKNTYLEPWSPKSIFPVFPHTSDGWRPTREQHKRMMGGLHLIMSPLVRLLDSGDKRDPANDVAPPVVALAA